MSFLCPGEEAQPMSTVEAKTVDGVPRRRIVIASMVGTTVEFYAGRGSAGRPPRLVRDGRGAPESPIYAARGVSDTRLR
jgi:hypothetical protein